ncbi:acidic endochitinase [Tanacetum coccineum]
MALLPLLFITVFSLLNPSKAAASIATYWGQNASEGSLADACATGGATGDYSLTSPQDAQQVADDLWNTYLGGQSTSRPLGNAVLDGIDFDIEKGTDQWNEWTTQVNTKNIFLGLLANAVPNNTGFIPQDVLTSQVLPSIKASPKYGGVMLWNRYFDQQSGYSNAIKNSV